MPDACSTGTALLLHVSPGAQAGGRPADDRIARHRQPDAEHRSDYERNALRPGYSASAPSASSMRSSWLYFATRSEREGAPVLICPQPVATARSAIVVSSVSPERCDITAV